MSHLPDVAAEIPFDRVRDFFHEVGIPTEGLVEVVVDRLNITASYFARDANGKVYAGENDQIAQHRFSIKLVR